MSDDTNRNAKDPHERAFHKRLKGLEPSTFCMARVLKTVNRSRGASVCFPALWTYGAV